MKKYLSFILAGATFIAISANASDADLKAELETLKKQVAELQAAQKKINVDSLKRQISEVKAHDANDNIKWSVDFRTSYDIVDYKIKGGEDIDNGVWTNRLILGMAAQPVDNLIFKGAVQVNKIFGNNNGTNPAMAMMGAAGNAFQNYDWFSSETPDDGLLRLREAYFLYFGEMGNVPYTASFGRRPAIGGMPVNLRDDDNPASPIGHNINMEFDGASFKFDLDKVTDISGLYLKLCLGRGNSNADGKYSDFSLTSLTQAPYSKTSFDSPNMDLAGIMAQLYNDGQYKVLFNWFYGTNMMGANVVGDPATGMPVMTGLTDVGNLTGGALALQIDGIGDEINDFLDDTIAFVSFAWSTTDPDKVHGVATPMGIMQMAQMLGSMEKETGTSWYAGVQMPCLITEDGRLGFEYNHGSKYWRSFTYGEDTLIGSKLAARGDAYEAYWTKPLVGDNLSLQLRYTYIDYEYTGSDAFFGQSGTPMKIADAAMMGMNPVDRASNFRAYLRYRY